LFKIEEVLVSISRRGVLAGALALPALTAGNATAQTTRIRYLLTSPSPIVAEAPHSSVPDVLGFWKEGGLDVDVKPFSGSTGATQLVLAGSAEFTMASPEGFIAGRQSDAKAIAVYSHTREPIYTIAVVAGSPLRKLEDLKGKTVGVLSLSSGAVPVAKAMLRGVGFDPEKDVKWLPVGLGPQTANALKSNQIDALALWDWGYAILENLGYEFRHFTTPETSKILSLMLIGNEDFVKANPGPTAKMAQGIAKGALFTLTNPEAAVRIHWQRYPSSKPTNLPEEQALKDAVHVLQARLEKYRIQNREIPKWGAFTKGEWEATQNFFFDTGLIGRKMEVSSYYTDQFVSTINDFDQNAIIANARSYK
jgi:NitT/TauT family transport system substrate-binding protein